MLSYGLGQFAGGRRVNYLYVLSAFFGFLDSTTKEHDWASVSAELKHWGFIIWTPHVWENSDKKASAAARSKHLEQNSGFSLKRYMLIYFTDLYDFLRARELPEHGETCIDNDFLMKISVFQTILLGMYRTYWASGRFLGFCATSLIFHISWARSRILFGL